MAKMGKEEHFKMSNTLLKYSDPFLIRKNLQVMADEEMFIEGAKVVVRPCILLRISNFIVRECEYKKMLGTSGLSSCACS